MSTRSVPPFSGPLRPLPIIWRYLFGTNVGRQTYTAETSGTSNHCERTLKLVRTLRSPLLKRSTAARHAPGDISASTATDAIRLNDNTDTYTCACMTYTARPK